MAIDRTPLSASERSILTSTGKPTEAPSAYDLRDQIIASLLGHIAALTSVCVLSDYSISQLDTLTEILARVEAGS